MSRRPRSPREALRRSDSIFVGVRGRTDSYEVRVTLDEALDLVEAPGQFTVVHHMEMRESDIVAAVEHPVGARLRIEP